MKKVFLTAVAVLALGSFNLNANPTIEIEESIEYADCLDAHLACYEASFQQSENHQIALTWAAICYYQCLDNSH